VSASHTLNLKKALIILSFFIGALLLAPAASAANCGGSVACSCGDSLNESRTLNASDNLTGCTGNGLNIIVTNVVLDCDGYPISGDNTGTNIGISIGTGLGNFTVRNCTITNFSGASERGIHAISRGVIEYNTITNCTYGIVADQGATSFSGTVRGNTISGGGSSGAGIYIASVNPTNITENTIYSNYNGLYISYYDTVNKIWRNNIYNNTNKNAFVSSATYMPFELSFNNEGNYWGHTCPSVFTAGTDSNAATVNDSYPYDIFNGWLTGSPADCVVPSATITAPSSGTTLPRTNYSITGTASDNVGIANVYVIITGSGTYTASYNGSTNAWSYTWDTSTEADGFYNITINASDAKGNYNDTSTATNIEIDKTPIISGVAAVSITSSGATITWTTDENANSTVDYGTTTALGSTSSNPSYVTSHSISLSSLSASTLYHYNVTSCDQTGNCQTEGTYNFTTSSIPAPACTAVGQAFLLFLRHSLHLPEIARCLRSALKPYLSSKVSSNGCSRDSSRSITLPQLWQTR